MVTHAARIVLGCLLVAVVLGCGSHARPPGSDGTADYARSRVHRVVSGDTLYSIAWRYGMKVQTLAAINRLRAPYTIYPGQTLRLGGSRVRRSALPRSSSRSTTARKSAKPSKKATKSASRRARATASAKPPTQWRWPVSGRVTKGFGNGNDGMDYQLEQGQRVVAAAPGEVVYAGNGLGGYRHLLIIKHSGSYLSAYSLNVDGRVAEGDRIQGGALLASMGGTSRRSRLLHFEIRKDGEPVDPRRVIGK